MLLASPLEEEEEEEEVQEEAGIVLRLGLFFDGTGNNLATTGRGEACLEAVGSGPIATVSGEVEEAEARGPLRAGW
ncbi:hypothetical protein ACIPZ8_26670 [Pseudomonas sp. NPDC089422]|uniref:hypothetical protein n=1 Tax=Pseudomonas sp. NPDC089422 TaxID=3364466 RepID=UPI0037FA4A82